MLTPQQKPDHNIAADGIPAALFATIDALCGAARDVSRIIAKGPLEQALGTEVGEMNSDGDGQKALDVIADDLFRAALSTANVRWYASEEQEDILPLDPDGAVAIAIDPLDGSGNIDVNVSIGTIFSLFDAKADAEASILRPGHEQIAAGYVIYGPQTGLMITFGNGTHFYILDPDSGRFCLVRENVTIPSVSSEYAINASNYRHWTKPVRTYIDGCMAGVEGPKGRNFNMRWIASLVAETHRIMSRGGIFLYPSDQRDGYGAGRLRMVYEAAPIAFLVEQAGGRATDSVNDILSLTAPKLHVRTAYVFGSADNVARVVDYHAMSDEELDRLSGVVPSDRR